MKFLQAIFKNTIISFIICIALSSCGEKTSEEALETKKILDKLNTKIEVGITQNEYRNVLADIKYYYKQIENEKEKEAFEKLIKVHEIAYDFWEECHAPTHPYNCWNSSPGMKLVLVSYPEIQSKSDEYTKHGSWHTDSVIKELWTIAALELEKIEL